MAEPKCYICLDGDDDPKPIQNGCACRGEAGLAHLQCAIKAAAHYAEGFHERWYECILCKQEFTGEMHLGLAGEIAQRLSGAGTEDEDKLMAQTHLAASRSDAGDHDGAETMLCEVLAIQKRCFGKDNGDVLTTTRFVPTY